MKKVAFIGLGNMGLPMALNLQRHGYHVTGFDVVSAARANAAEAGLNVAGDAATAVDASSVTITMLPNGDIAKSVAHEVVPRLVKNTLLIECSTVDVESARTIHALADEHGVHCLDAPVSGGVGGATAGTLTFMAGGTEVAFTQSGPLLDVMGQKAVHCGDGGTGQAAKICNNMLLAISMIGTCEAFSLADKLGLDKERLFDVMSTSSGSCWSVNTYCPVPNVGPKSPADNDYQPGFAAALMLKDLNLAMQAAKNTNADTIMGEQATELYAMMNELGHGNQDFSAIINKLTTLKKRLS